MTSPVDVESRPGLDLLVKSYVEARIAREQAVNLAKERRRIEDRVAGELFDAMERLNLRSVRTTDKGVFMLNDLAWAKVENVEQARSWAQDNMPELLALNVARLSTVVRRWLKGEEGVDLPPGVGFTASRKINWRERPGGNSDREIDDDGAD